MELSQDEISHVFSFLPAKSICKFKCVSKDFSELLEEQSFAIKQAQNFLLEDDSCFFIQPDTCQRYSDRIEIHPLSREELSSGVSRKSLQFLEKSAKILASSNGLILCRTTTNTVVRLFICNPATLLWLPIPTPEHLQKTPDADVHVCFECRSSDSNDYRIILIENPTDWSSGFDVKVYLPKEGVWKEIEGKLFTGSRNMKLDMPVFSNAAVHFISDTFPYLDPKSEYFLPYIMAYNPDSGVSTMLRVPKEATRGFHDYTCDMSIFHWGKVRSSVDSFCLVRLRKSVFKIWVLTDYESCSWRRILKIRVKAMGLREQDPSVSGFTVINGDYLVFSTEKMVYGYGLSGKTYRRLEELCEHGCESRVRFTSYSNTLRPCGTGATSLPGYATNHPNEDDITTAAVFRGHSFDIFGEEALFWIFVFFVFLCLFLSMIVYM